MADDVKNPNPNLIDEKDIPANWVPVAGSPSSPQGAAPPLPNEMPTFFSGSIAPQLQHDSTFVGTEVASPGVPKFALMPFGNQSSPLTNAAAQSTATKTVVGTVTTPGTPTSDVESIFINPQGGTQYTVQVGDRGELDTFNNNAGGTIVLPGGSLLPNVFSSEAVGSGGGTSMSASGTPYNANSAVIFLGSTSSYASQSGIAPSGSGWTTIDAGADGAFAAIYSKILPGVSPLTVSATIGATAWAESLLFFQNVNKAPQKVQFVTLTSGGVGTGTVTGTFPNPVTKGNLILLTLFAGAMANDIHNNPIPAAISASDDVNGGYGTVVDTISDQYLGGTGPQAGYSITQFAALTQNVAAGSTTVSVTVTFPSMSGGVFGSCTINAYEISLGNATPVSTGFDDGWYCYLENTGSGTFSVQSTALIDGSSSPVSMGSNSGLIVAFDGTNWFTERGAGGGGGGVTSVFGRTGAVIAVSGDYSQTLISAGAIANGSTATTQSPGDNSTKVATDAYVDAAQALDEKIANKDVASGYAGLTSAVMLKLPEQATAVDARTTTSEAIADSDRAKLVTFSNTSATAATIAQAGASSNFLAGWYCDLVNENTGIVTLTPTTSTIDGQATLILQRYEGVRIVSDGANYFTVKGQPTIDSPNDADILTYIAADKRWESKSIGTVGGANASQIRGTNITATSPKPRQVLVYNEANADYEPTYIAPGRVNWHGWGADPSNNAAVNAYGGAWLVTSNTSASVNASATEPFYSQVSSPGTANNAFYGWNMSVAQITTGIFRYSTARCILSSTGTNAGYFLGLCSAVSPQGIAQSATLAANFVGFRFWNGTDTHWQAYVGTDATHITLVDTGITPDTNSHIYEIYSDGTNFHFCIDGTRVASISVTDTNAPATTVRLGMNLWLSNQNGATTISLSTAYAYWESSV